MDEALAKRIRDNLISLDSYLSLFYYRYSNRAALEDDAKRDIEDAITECRKLQKELQVTP